MHGALHGLAFTVGAVDGAQQPPQVRVAEQVSQLLRLTWNQGRGGNSAFHGCTGAKVSVNVHPGAAASARPLGR